MDRNIVSAFDVLAVSASLSARRAWIEMSIFVFWTAPSRVALRKESVDRNKVIKIDKILDFRRSPQGERG